MPRTRINLPLYTFVGGKITEAGPTTFPDNAGKVVTNWDVKPDGSIDRRLGIELEDGYQYPITVPKANYARTGINYYVWRGPANIPDKKVLVLQVDHMLYIFDMDKGAVSANLHSSLDMSPYIRDMKYHHSLMAFDSGHGALFCCSKVMNPCFIEYKSDTDTYEVTQYQIKIRDFKGVDDGLKPDERPHVCSAKHNYNLRNQGWPRDFNTVGYHPQADPVDAAGVYYYSFPSISEGYPSNKQSIQNYIVDSGDTQGGLYLGYFWPDMLDKRQGKDTLEMIECPKGHFILDAFQRDRDNCFVEEGYLSKKPLRDVIGGYPSHGAPALSFTGVNIDTPDYNMPWRPTTLCFFSGRVFYAGAPNPLTAGTIYFSRIIQDLEKDAGRCYQRQDPTAPEINQITGADGGTIEIPEAGIIYAIFPVGEGLIAIASNGAWGIAGGTEAGFSAEKYRVYKISSAEFRNVLGWTTAGSMPIVAGSRGIYTMGQDKVNGNANLQDITEKTIKTDYVAIPQDARDTIRAVYDWVADRVVFLYNNTGDFVTNHTPSYRYDRAIILNMKHGCLYDYEFADPASNDSFIAGAFQGPDYTRQVYTENVTVGGTSVTVSAVAVTVELEDRVPANSSMMYLVFADLGGSDYSLTFATAVDDNYRDFYSVDNTSNYYDSTYLTGWDISVGIASTGGTIKMANRRKQSAHFLAHFERTETAFVLDSNGNLAFDKPSSASVRFRWNWADDSTSNKWSSSQEVYRLPRLYIPAAVGAFTYPYEIITTKTRVRGSGRSLAVELTVGDGNHCHCYGWEVLQDVGEGH